MLYVFWVGCYDAVYSSGANEDGGVGGTVAEDLGGPLEEAVAV